MECLYASTWIQNAAIRATFLISMQTRCIWKQLYILLFENGITQCGRYQLQSHSRVTGERTVRCNHKCFTLNLYSAIISNAFVWERVIAHGDPECRMTLTVIDPENYDEDGKICVKPKAVCKDSDWQINPPKSDLNGYSIDDIMDSQDRLLNGKLAVYDGDANLFINAAYEHGTIPPRAFWIPFPLQSAYAFLNISVCMRAQSKCSKGVTLTIGECSMTMPLQSLQEPIESQCWSSTWTTKNLALEEGLFIELEGTCRMHVIIWSDDIKKCILDWNTLIELHSYQDSEDTNDHPITIKYSQGTLLRTGTSKHQQIGTDTVAFSRQHGVPLKIGERVYNSTTFVTGSSPNPDDKNRGKGPELVDFAKRLQGKESQLELEDFYYEKWGMIDDQKQEVYNKTNPINKNGSLLTFDVNDTTSWSVTTNEEIETWIDIFPDTHYLLEQLHIECEDVEWRSPLTRITVTHSNGRVEQFDNANNSDPRFLYGTCKPGTGECLNNSTDNSTGQPNNAESSWSSAKLYWSLAAALIGFMRM